jgi:recombination protein RecT
MNAVTQAQPRNPADQLRHQLVQMAPEFRNALPSHIKPEKFQRVVMTVVQQQPGLLNADRRSLLASCMKCAADGLVPDGREAALVLFGNQCQYMPMFTGVQKRIRNSNEIASIQSHVIYENDHFVIRRGLNETIEHTPLFPGDRGKPIGAYAIAKFKDGSDPMFEVMDVAAIERVRSVSKSKNNGPWVQWWDEMARKTVFRRLAKWLPMDAEVDELLRQDDRIGAPTDEVATIDGEASLPVQQISHDPFLQASQGEQADEGRVIGGEIITADAAPSVDPDANWAQQHIDAVNACTTVDEIKALDGNKAFASKMNKLKAEKPALWESVRDAMKIQVAALSEGV